MTPFLVTLWKRDGREFESSRGIQVEQVRAWNRVLPGRGIDRFRVSLGGHNNQLGRGEAIVPAMPSMRLVN